MVYVRTMVVEDKMDAAILQTLVKKAEQIREDYGFSPPYFGDDAGVLAIIDEQGLDAGIPQTTLEEFGEKTADQGSADAFDDETLDRIASDLFYGHTEVDLADVRRRLEATRERIGGEDGLQRFVQSALNLFGCNIETNADGTFDIEVTTDRLLGGDVAREYANVTFNAHEANERLDIEMLDVAHPLVQRLIEAAKEAGFTEEDRYGRTAAQGSDAVDREVAVYTVLIRYVAATKPDPTIMEELVDIGLGLFEDEPRSQSDVRSIRESTPANAGRSEQEIQDDLATALDHPQLDDAIGEHAETRRREIEDERSRIRERIAETTAPEWLDGIDDVSIGSTDLLIATIYYPN
jgi:hypothetical protein